MQPIYGTIKWWNTHKESSHLIWNILVVMLDCAITWKCGICSKRSAALSDLRDQAGDSPSGLGYSLLLPNPQGTNAPPIFPCPQSDPHSSVKSMNNSGWEAP